MSSESLLSENSPVNVVLQFPPVPVAASFAFFNITSRGLSRFAAAPKELTARGRAFRWHNISVSLLHSVIGSVMSIMLLFNDPKVLQDPYGRKSEFLISFISMSLGYFIYDAVENIRSRPLSQCWEILFHHSIMVSTQLTTLLDTNLAMMMGVALLTEINSIFIHTRQLMLMAGQNMCHASYRLVSYLTIITFCIRFAVVAWLLGCYMKIGEEMKFVQSKMLFVLSLAMLVLNVTLLMRICVADILQIPRPARSPINKVRKMK